MDVHRRAATKLNCPSNPSRQEYFRSSVLCYFGALLSLSSSQVLKEYESLREEKRESYEESGGFGRSGREEEVVSLSFLKLVYIIC